MVLKGGLIILDRRRKMGSRCLFCGREMVMINVVSSSGVLTPKKVCMYCNTERFLRLNK